MTTLKHILRRLGSFPAFTAITAILAIEPDARAKSGIAIFLGIPGNA